MSSVMCAGDDGCTTLHLCALNKTVASVLATRRGSDHNATTRTVMLSMEPRVEARSHRARAAPSGSDARKTDEAHLRRGYKRRHTLLSVTAWAKGDMASPVRADGRPALLLIDDIPEAVRGEDKKSVARREGDGRELGRRRDAIRLQVRIPKCARDGEIALDTPASRPDDLATRRLPSEASERMVSVAQRKV